MTPSIIYMAYSSGVDSWLTRRLLEEIYPSSDLRFLHVDFGHRGCEKERRLLPAGTLCMSVRVLADMEKAASYYKRREPMTHPRSSAFISGRNLVIMSILMSLAGEAALSQWKPAIATGIDPENRNPSPDASLEFLDYVKGGIRFLDSPCEIPILTPLVGMSKAAIYSMALERGCDVSEETWSCYDSLPIPCGVCWQCLQRKEAFHELGLSDPTVYNA